MSDQSHSIDVVETFPVAPVRDVSPWHPAVQPNNTESAIRELQNTLVYIIREMDRHGRQIAALESQIVKLKNARD